MVPLPLTFHPNNNGASLMIMVSHHLSVMVNCDQKYRFADEVLIVNIVRKMVYNTTENTSKLIKIMINFSDDN